MATQIRVAQLTGSFPSSGRSAATSVGAAVGGDGGNDGDLGDVLDHMASAIKRLHGASIFTGAAAGTFHTDILPNTSGAQDLGSTTQEFGDVYIADAKALKLGSGQEHTIADASSGLEVDSSETIAIESSKSSGDGIKIGGDTVASKITIGGETSTRTEVEMNAILLDLNAGSGGITMDAAGASNLTTSSGALTLDGAGGVSIAGNAAEVDITTSGAVDINGAAVTVDASSTLSLQGAGATDLTTSSGAVVIDAAGTSSGAGNVEINSAGGEIKIGHDAVAAKISVGADTSTRTEVEVNAILLDLNAGSGGLTMDAAGASNLTTSSGALTLDGAGGVSIAGNAAEVDVTTTGALDLNGAAVTVDASSTLSLDAADSTNLTMVAGSSSSSDKVLTIAASNSASSFNGNIDVDADGEIYIDAGEGISIDAAAASNLSTSAGAMTMAGVGVDIDATGSGTLNLDGAGGINIGTAADVAFDVDSAAVDWDASGAFALDTSSGGISLDGAAASNFTTAAGALTLDGAGGVSIAGNAAEVDITTSGAFDVNVGSVDLDSTAGIAIDGTTLSLDGTDTTNLTMTADSASNKTMSITAANDGDGDGLMVLTADTITIAGNLDVNGTTTTIDTTSVAISDHNIVLDRDNGTSAVVDGCGLTMEGGSGDDITFQQASSSARLELKKGSGWHGLAVGNLVANGATIDIDGSTSVLVDTAVLSLDGTDDSNVTVTGSAKDLDIAVAGGGTQELRLTSAGTGASAMHLNASAGGINIDSADMIDIDAADEITIDTTSADGHIAITSAHTAGDSIVISANADAGAILNIDAGIMDVDVQGAYTLDASGVSIDSDAASNLTTSSGALTITSAAAATWGTAAGDLTLDVAGDIVLDADGANVTFKDAGTAYLDILQSGGNAILSGSVHNNDIILHGNTATEVARVDSSAGSFLMASTKQLQFGTSGDYISGTGSALSVISGGDILLDPAGGDVNVDGNLMSQTDSTDSIGRGAAEHVAGSSASGLTSNLASGQSITMSTSQSQAVLYGSSLTAGSGSSAPSGITTSTLQTSSLSSFSSTPSGTLSFSGNGGASVAAGTIMSLQDSGGNKFFFVVVEAYSGSSSSSSMKIHALTNISGHTTSVSSFSTIEQHSSISGSSALSGVSASAGETVAFTDGSSNKFVFVLEAAISSGTPWGFIGDPRDDLSDSSSWSSSTSFASATAGGSVAASNCWASVNVDECFLQQVSEPSSSSDKLYNVGGTLYWSGAPIGTPAIYRHVMLSSETSSGSYTVDSGDLTGDSDVTFTSSTAVNKVLVYLNGQLQYIANSGGDVALSSTENQLVFGSGGLVTDDIIQVIVYA